MTKKQKTQLLKIIISTALLATVFILSKMIQFSWYAAAVLYFVPYVIIGFAVLKKAVKNLLSGQMLDENFLMAIATLGAFALKEYPEAVFVMLFYQVGELFESIAVGKSRSSISALMDICPEKANVLREGELLSVDPGEVQLLETVIVKPGEKIPLDGTVIDGASSLDTKALTGEAVPRDVTVGDKVVSGCININGAISIKVEKTFGDSTVSKILELVENTASVKSKSEAFITRFSKIYTPVVVLLALLLAVIPPMFLGNWADWIHRGLIVLVVSCPCALVLSVPLSFFSGIGGASKKGILVKGSEYLEKLARIEIVVFDKTGTLTKGTFRVTDVTGENTLYYAAAAEQLSTHPIAVSIKNAYSGKLKMVAELTEYAGFGLQARVENDIILCGNKKLMDKFKISAPETQGTAVYVAVNGRFNGTVTVSDEIKETAAEAVESIKAFGIKKTVMLTGDSLLVAEKVKNEIGIDEVKAQLLPDEKVSALTDILKERSAAYVGDGINDAPVLALADVGISMGAFGADAAIEASDIVLMQDDPIKVAEAIKIARKTRSIVIENIVFSLVIKIAVLILSALSVVGMSAAIFADVGVLVLAVLNAMRGLNVKR